MPNTCPHELRPGIKVCYHCVHEARAAASARRFGQLKRGAGVFLALMVIAGAGSLGLQFLRDRELNRLPPSPPSAVAENNTTAAPSSQVTRTVEAAHAPANNTVNAATGNAATRAAGSALAPVIPEGDAELSGGMRATRSGDTVTVNFDTPMLRTRRAAKFEDIVRSSLIEVYGARADSFLSGIPRGSLVQVEDLFAELPTRGLHIGLPAGGTLALWPQTRMRDDGPLVIAYRATVTR